MFFVLSKTLDLLIDPVVWVAGPLLVGLWLSTRERWRRAGLGLVGMGLLLFLLGSLPAVANRLWASLEREVPSSERREVTYDAVVLLGGVVDPLGSVADRPAWNDGIERLLTTRSLLAAGRARRVIISGGRLGVPGLQTEAAYVAQELEALGVARDRIILEDQALNTRENAILTKALVLDAGLEQLLVVTSAFHLPRAKGCFEAVGLTADYLPVDFRMREPARDSHVLPRVRYLEDTARVVRERVGRWVYRAMGYST